MRHEAQQPEAVSETGTITTGAAAGSASYAYDGLDRRVTTAEQTEFGTNTTGTVWDGFDPAATSSDLHGATDLFRDPYGAVAFQDGPYGNEWVLGDQRNATATAGADGAITDLVDYADFGAADYESTGWSSLVGNDQQPGDPTLGLDNYYARDYDTTTGSWVQPDEWRGLLQRPQSLNRYAYIENTPVAFSDDLGYVIKAMRMSDGGSSAVAGKAIAKSRASTIVSALNGKAKADTLGRSDTSRDARIGASGGLRGAGLPMKDGIRTPADRSKNFVSAVHGKPICSWQNIECTPGKITQKYNLINPKWISGTINLVWGASKMGSGIATLILGTGATLTIAGAEVGIPAAAIGAYQIVTGFLGRFEVRVRSPRRQRSLSLKVQ